MSSRKEGSAEGGFPVINITNKPIRLLSIASLSFLASVSLPMAGMANEKQFITDEKQVAEIREAMKGQVVTDNVSETIKEAWTAAGGKVANDNGGNNGSGNSNNNNSDSDGKGKGGKRK